MFGIFKFLRSKPSKLLKFKARKRSRLQVENLESRTLLSGSPLDGLVATPAGHLGSAAYYNPYPSGYTPSQISHAYGFDQITFNDGTIEGDGSGQTIAIVDAYRNPNIASDLHVFDQT